MAQTVQDPSLQNVQASNSGGAQTFGQAPNSTNSSGTPTSNGNSQSNQSVTFNQTPTNGGQGQQSSTSSGRNKPQGTGFTNVNNILTANQGNNLGQTIQSGITNAANNVQNNINSSAGSFNQGVQSNLLNNAQNNQNVQNIVSGASNLQAGQTIDPTQLAQYETYTAGGYQGPTGLQNGALLQGQAQAAQALGQDVNSTSGQQNLLQQFVGNGQYTQGQQTLDQLLLGQQQGALNQAQGFTFGLNNQANSAVNNASQIANQAVATNRAFGQQAVLAAQNAQNPITSNINTNVTNDLNAQNQQQYQYNQLQSLLNETPQQYSSQVSALSNPSAQGGPQGGVASTSTGNPAVDQINAVLANLSGLGVDNNTLTQLATTDLQNNIGNIPGYLNQIMGATTLNNPNPLSVSSPTTSGYGTLSYAPSASDVSALQNQNAVTTQAQAAQLNALSQLAGGTGNINASGVGTYTPGTVGVNLADLTPPSIYGNGATVTPTPNSSGLGVLGNTTSGIVQGVGDIASPVVGSTLANANNQGFNTLGQLSQGNVGGAAGTAVTAPVAIGNQLVNQINQNPVSGIPVVGSLLGNQIGNPLSSVTTPLISVGQNLASQITNPIQQVFGGGGGKIICNELHRQGYISDKIIKLDEEFGKKYRKLNPDAYRGYLLIATPIVALMKRSPLFTTAISKISLPWASFMANKMDATINGSILGHFIHNVGMFVFPKIYKINKLIKRVNSEYSKV